MWLAILRPEALQATGTDDQTAKAPETALQLAQQLERETWRSAAKGMRKRRQRPKENA
tara:strand:- start:181 stop:354 length:174 start_codon:yes stop_codon:yes gene_type:complete